MEKIKNDKERKIIDVNFDGDHLHFDLRFSFPVENLSGELIKDLLEENDKGYKFTKNNLINGTFSPDKNPIWLNFYLKIGEDDNGNDTFQFVKRAKELK